MNDQPCAEKVINSCLSQIKYELLTIDSGLERFSNSLKRIYEDTKTLQDPPSDIPQPSFEGLFLTGKVKFLEDLSKWVEINLCKLNDKLDSLI